MVVKILQYNSFQLFQCLIVFAMMNPQVTTCIITQKVLKNKANRASLKVKMGTSGRSSSVCPIRWPVARAQTFSTLFIIIYTIRSLHPCRCHQLVSLQMYLFLIPIYYLVYPQVSNKRSSTPNDVLASNS